MRSSCTETATLLVPGSSKDPARLSLLASPLLIESSLLIVVSTAPSGSSSCSSCEGIIGSCEPADSLDKPLGWLSRLSRIRLSSRLRRFREDSESYVITMFLFLINGRWTEHGYKLLFFHIEKRENWKWIYMFVDMEDIKFGDCEIGLHWCSKIFFLRFHDGKILCCSKVRTFGESSIFRTFVSPRFISAIPFNDISCAADVRIFGVNFDARDIDTGTDTRYCRAQVSRMGVYSWAMWRCALESSIQLAETGDKTHKSHFSRNWSDVILCPRKGKNCLKEK